MYEILWMLLPVAAAGGWVAGRHSLNKRSTDHLWTHATSYHRDLHQLLTERQNGENSADALDFGHLGSVEHDAAETHLALGNLFRRRGDVERAIQVHRSLLDKVELSDSLRAEARLELARDYDSAGLMDRSEEQFRILLDEDRHVADSYENLLLIFERASDWNRAIELAHEYQTRCGCNLAARISHYNSELAVLARRRGDYQLVESKLNAALEIDPQCARANMLFAELALERGDHQKTIEYYEQVEAHRPELIPEIISPLFDALVALDDNEKLRAYIDRIRSRYNAYSVIKTTRDMIEKLDGPEQADRFFKEQIVNRPSLKGLRDWARGQLEYSRSGEREKVAVMCDMLDRVVEEKPAYVCESCGFGAQALYWRCPGCSSWDTVATVIGAEGE